MKDSSIEGPRTKCTQGSQGVVLTETNGWSFRPKNFVRNNPRSGERVYEETIIKDLSGGST